MTKTLLVMSLLLNLFIGSNLVYRKIIDNRREENVKKLMDKSYDLGMQVGLNYCMTQVIKKDIWSDKIL